MDFRSKFLPIVPDKKTVIVDVVLVTLCGLKRWERGEGV
jgi:hypothetical protein